MSDTDRGLGAALFLGALQGLTEFLPVSSSGHLVLFQQFLTLNVDHVLFDLVLHVGTLIPVIWFYRADVAPLLTDPISGEGPFFERPGVKMAGLIVAASIPTGIIGLTFKDFFEQLFANPASLTVSFAITGTLLFLAGRFDRSAERRELTIPLALALGLAQGFAITPGVSRSGTTIAVALMLGLPRDVAARFSFLMAIPAILGAVLLKAKDAELSHLDPLQLGVGFLTSMVVGYFALTLLVRLVLAGRFSSFCWYAWCAAIVAGLIAYT
jgi:undecaprenyl-diphosphatase